MREARAGGACVLAVRFLAVSSALMERIFRKQNLAMVKSDV